LELRKKGLTAASRKTSRTATDGLLAVANNGDGVTAVVEINSETDFVARNEMFRHLVWKSNLLFKLNISVYHNSFWSWVGETLHDFEAPDTLIVYVS